MGKELGVEADGGRGREVTKVNIARDSLLEFLFLKNLASFGSEIAIPRYIEIS